MFEFREKEEKVLKFWKKRKIYEKSKKNNSNGRKFYFMDGPPYANGKIHMGTALNKIMKDVAMRYKRSRGFNVFDRPGYDTHGLPIEFQVEKEIGSTSKKDIEKYGTNRFIERCKQHATKYIEVMNKEFANLGVWMDWGNPYLTLDDKYIEAVWNVLKKANEKELLYLGKYPVHLCPRCETAVAYNEIEYDKQDDLSVFIKFPLQDRERTFLIIWTTTPWTLPGNTGIMVNPGFVYEEIEMPNKERWIIAKDIVPDLMKEIGTPYVSRKKYKGSEMKGWKYSNPLSKNLRLDVKKGYEIVLSARYVNIDEGSGLVHCAPGHGKEDFEVGKENGLDMSCPVDISGRFTKQAGKYSGKKVKEANDEIISDLEKSGFLIYKKKYSHDYPLCWRCKTSLLMISQPQWFLKISGIHDRLLKENEKTNWTPHWMKSRMKAWLDGISDWPVSRERYWGTPLPIWVCEKCGSKKVVGSISELKKLSGKKRIDMHKPGIDKIEMRCSCKAKMKRVTSVLDVWLDSGVSSWAALEYPSKKDKFKKFWPADLNLEGKDQVRGWWNSQLILSVIGFDKKPFENIVVHGMVLDVNKAKMSKSTGNVVSPADLITRYGRDYLRYYFVKASRGSDIAFDEKEFKEIQGVFRVLVNVNNFVNQLRGKISGTNAEDKWILSRLNSVLKETGENFDNYKFYEGVTKLEEFLIGDLSKRYIQIIRERSDEARAVLDEIRKKMLIAFSPVIPFLTENLWQDLSEKKAVKEESVHLSSWPKPDSGKINKKLEKEFSVAFELIERGLAERDGAKIGLRWPLAYAKVFHTEKIPLKILNIVANQLNVKRITLNESKNSKVILDTKITPELEAEGFAREISRKVQSERKKRGLEKKNLIVLRLSTGSNLRSRLEKFAKMIKSRTGSKKLEFTDDKKEFIFFKVKDEEIGISF